MPSSAEALAPWIELSRGGRLYDKLLTVFDGQCLPTKDSVDLAIPDGARVVIVSWSGKRPTCETNSHVSGQPVSTIVLATKDSFETILSWYRNAFAESDYVEYEIPLGIDCECTGKRPRNEREVIFAPIDVEKFCWNKHYPETYPLLIVKEAGDPWNTHGYATTIEFHQSAI